jgi:predicted RecB family nuclease
MVINNEILTALIHCNYKAYLKGQNFQSSKSDFEIVINELREIQKQNYFAKNLVNQEFKSQLFNDKNHYELNQIYINTTFKNDKINIKLDGFYFVENKILPILIIPLEKVTKIDRLTIALQSHFIQGEFKLKIDSAKIIFGKQLKETKLKLPTFQKEIRQILSSIKKLENAVHPPVFYKNPHCQICEFSKDCLEKLREKDDLSLLGNLKEKEKEIEQKNNRGIFSVKQLSYTFRHKKNPYLNRKYLPELKALAIREQKTFILEITDLKKHETEVFIDFEGIPDRNSNYLIGLIIRTGDIEDEYSFWANNEDDETKIFIELIEQLKPLKNFTLYHYGAYEIQGFKKVSKNLTIENQNFVNILIDNSFNLLNLFTHCIYPPTYTNSLKDIAHFLNFEWSDKNASGLQSIIWRYRWELTDKACYKDKLMTYNLEDCRALKIIKDWIYNIPKLDNQNFENAKNFKKESMNKWGRVNFLVQDLEKINSYAYFNYQREKVLIKTYPKIGLRKKKKSKSVSLLHPNKIIVVQRPKICESCKSEKFYRHDIKNRTVIDLKITKTGIKRFIILYKNARYKCVNCKKIVIPRDEYDIRSKYGAQLQNWIINQMIQYRNSYNKISEQLKESFDIVFSSNNVSHTKTQFANKYKSTFDEITNVVKNSSVIHIDETIFHIRNESCYIWVFTNIDAVFYLFKPTREADFLKELLCDFNGVLISDFYAGYDAMKCAKQRCLIHLIRDLNDDLVKNQFDANFKIIVLNFSKLLTNITNTISKFGLKKRNLNKHKSEVETFFKTLNKLDFETDICLKWQKRFNSTKNELFTFLNYDGVPWNNNNAESAIKAVALYRREYDGLPTKNGIQDYLTLLSIQQTCKYQGLNFFEFLKSGKASIYDRSKK